MADATSKPVVSSTTVTRVFHSTASVSTQHKNGVAFDRVTGIITKMGAKSIIAASVAGGARDARLIPERRGWAPLGGAAGGGSSALD